MQSERVYIIMKLRKHVATSNPIFRNHNFPALFSCNIYMLAFIISFTLVLSQASGYDSKPPPKLPPVDHSTFTKPGGQLNQLLHPVG